MTGAEKRARLTPRAIKVMEALIEEFRLQIKPDMAPLVFRAAAYELMDAGLAVIYQDGDRFRFDLTPEAAAMFSGPVQ